MRRASRRLVIVLAGMVLASAAVAEDNRPVKLETKVIRATTRDSTISPALRSLAAQLKKSFRFSGYHLLSENSAQVKLGQEHRVALPHNYEASFKPEKRDGKRIVMRVEIFELSKQDGKTQRKSKLRTVLKMESGAATMVGGLRIDQGDTLILALKAE